MQFQLTILLHLGLLSYTKDQEECNMGACRPPTGNLLVGRGDQLSASSTCGLSGVQKYCILSYLEGEQKCFICDSRFPYDPYTQPNSHTIENVITSFEPDRENKWWQSENGLDHVSVRLDLEALFQFSHLILKFKTFRPAAMLVERSTDYGHSWKVFKYFAKNCAASFPNISSGQAQEVGDLVCDSKYSDIEPSTGGEVVLKALDPRFHIENPYSPYIQDLMTLTNLRINFTKLHTLGDTLLGRRHNDSFDNYYYAVSEMVVRGSCFCHGHASECGPRQMVRGDVFSPPGMVHGQCVCQHNTDGPNCERCKDFFQDAPWQPAAGLRDSTCRACRCNHHAQRCHFDRSRYVASGGLSGGVCEDCQHHTEGPHCERCRPLFYRNPSRPLSDPYTCLPCECDPDGTISGGICVSHSDPALGTVAGQCLCKEHVEGAKCDRCKPHYYGLSATDSLGCQPCNCHSWGSLPLSTCDADTGQCLCQPFATGPRCEECIVGYWGLENHLRACSPCGCDVGGAYSNACSPQTGQCECRPDITGRTCTKPAPGYFFAPLTFYLYEAEEAMPLQQLAPLDSVASEQVSAVHVIFREPIPGTPVTWTGPGFAKVLPGTGLRFVINNIPFPMDFAIAIRYEAQTSANWAAQIMVTPSEERKHCSHKTPQGKSSLFTLPTTSRVMLLPTTICLEPDVQYSIDVYFSQSLEGGSHAHSHILVDSLGLIPQISSLENSFSKQDLEEYQLHNCMEIASEIGSQVLPGVCERLIVSLSALLHNGALACNCHPQGSLGPHCSQLGGQCQCQPRVTGRSCDRCSPGSYKLGHQGCLECHCHPQGSKSTVCDQITGQCSCHREVTGHHCDQCLAGYFGFPNCRPCLCNGFAELCDPETGFCINCKGLTAGRNCERCIEGYHGNPSAGQSCRPCQCPGVPSSNQYFAHSCYQNPWSTDVICNCHQGYTGAQCEECAAGFYGNPRTGGAPCQPCACNNNIDVTDAGSCNQVTGECLRCLHNTQGPNCQFCKPGYFGSAFNQTCKRCSCYPLGVNPAECPPDLEVCLCDPDTGSCACLPNVTGQNCDHCADGYWNLIPSRGCQPCDCDPRTSHSSQCDQFTGQCPCKSGYGGKHCRECKKNHYGGPLGQCIPCDCNREGTQEPICDQATGTCHCREGVSGQRCDHCARGHGQEFPACLRCHLCFDQWDHTISALSKAVQGLIKLAANMEDKREALSVCEADFKGLRKNMSEIEKILKYPVFSSGEFLKVKDYQDFLGKQIMQLSEQLKTVYEFQDLKETIITMGNTANFLVEDIQKKIGLYSKSHNTSIMDSLENIKMHYQRSSSAEKITKETFSDINNSKKTRTDLVTTLDTLFSKGNLSLETLKQIKLPDIQILSEKVIFTMSNFPCKVCGDHLCVSSSCSGPICPGSLNLSRNAFQKAQDAESLIHNLNNQVQGLKTQIKNTSKLAEVSQNNTLQLSEKLRNMKNQSESEEEKINLLIKKLKKIVLEENVPPEDIEKIANHVLDTHLPITSQNLTHELDKIRKLTQLREDYKRDENKLKKAADEVPKILQKAKEAEEAANVLLNLDNMLNDLQQVQIIQGQANSAITQLTAKITNIRKNVLQAENQTKETRRELDLEERQLDLKDGLSQLQTKLQRNQEQTLLAKAQAESAQRQAGGLEEGYVELKNQYAALQHKTSATGLTKETIEKVKRLKDAAEKLAEDTEDKIRRVTDLEKKIRDLNLSRQEKVDQLKQLEDQVIAIKNEIVEQENKYAECYT
ncbi:laminin subunit beta-4 [Sorex fumeus]|uniref:laminin subunit beta-4 n=1 Tax=Sorex fumeus TaxID=62283 RepID=UPI0024ACE56C|nr:laminin subunit beta-4 [Sorex fumeus]